MDFSDNFYTLRKLTGDYYSTHQDIDLMINNILQKGIIVPVEYKRQASNKGNHLKNIFRSLFHPDVFIFSKIKYFNREGRIFELEWLNDKKESVCKTKYVVTKFTGIEDKRNAPFMRCHKSYIKITEKPFNEKEINLVSQFNEAKNTCYQAIHSFLIIVLTRQKMINDTSKICETFNLPNNLLDKIKNKQIENEELLNIIKTNFVIPYNDLTEILFFSQYIQTYSSWFTQVFLPNKPTHDTMKEIVKTGFVFFDNQVKTSIKNFLAAQLQVIDELKKYQILP